MGILIRILFLLFCDIVFYISTYELYATMYSLLTLPTIEPDLNFITNEDKIPDCNSRGMQI